jgi:hypothetical protein
MVEVVDRGGAWSWGKGGGGLGVDVGAKVEWLVYHH